MGATPTKANLELIRKYAPLDQFSLKVSARKTGHSKDEVEVTPPAVVYDFKVQHMGCRAKPLEMVTLGIMQGRMDADKHTDVEHCFGVRDPVETHVERARAVESGCAAAAGRRRSARLGRGLLHTRRRPPCEGVSHAWRWLTAGGWGWGCVWAADDGGGGGAAFGEAVRGQSGG